MDIVGENIRRIRRSRGLLQKQLADKAGIDPSNLSKLERGEYTWTKENLEKIATALGVNVSDFFSGEAKVPMLGYVRAGMPEHVDPVVSWQTLTAIDAKLEHILKMLGQVE